MGFIYCKNSIDKNSIGKNSIEFMDKQNFVLNIYIKRLTAALNEILGILNYKYMDDLRKQFYLSENVFDSSCDSCINCCIELILKEQG